MNRALVWLSSVLVLVPCSDAGAATYDRTRHHGTAVRHPETPSRDPAGGWEAEAIARATVRMQEAPGLTNELAPDAKATATGGPVGGVPGFEGF